MKKIRNIFIILFYLTGIPFLRFWFLKRSGSLLRVIVFHEIKNKDSEAFRSFISFLSKRYNVVSPKDIVQGRLSGDRLNIMLTFDDGYASWMRNVIPTLHNESLPAVFFIPSGFVGRDGYVAWDDVRVLNSGDFTVGGHTVSHTSLSSLSDEEAHREIYDDKIKLQQELVTDIWLFAYPFGDVRNVKRGTSEVVVDAGYVRAFTILPGFNHEWTDSLWMHRDSLQPTMSRILVRAWLMGSYDCAKKFVDWFV